jgi:hypothetical protein
MNTPKKDQADAKKKVLKAITLDITSDKYKMLVKYCNKLIDNIEEVDQIKDVLEFKNINRLEIVKVEGQQVYKDMMDEIYGVFDKTKCGYYYRKAANAPLNFLRGACKECGLKLQITKKEVSLKDKGGGHKTGYFNSIVKK